MTIYEYLGIIAMVVRQKNHQVISWKTIPIDWSKNGFHSNYSNIPIINIPIFHCTSSFMEHHFV
jgi:hypothetical protein